MNAPLRVEGLGFSYGSRLLLHDWSQAFGAGLTWVRGRNGCGKSTLLKLIGGALPPQRGRIVANGTEQGADPLGYRRQVFWVGPGAPAFDHLTPAEFFAFLRGLYPRWDEAASERCVAGFSLGPSMQLPLARLSTGTQRKVWVSAGLAAGTAVTLLDEPLAALDAASCAFLQQALRGAATEPGRAWLVCSHEALEPASVSATLDLDAEPLIR